MSNGQNKQQGNAPFTEAVVAVVENDNPIAAADDAVPTAVVAVVEFLAPHYDFAGANLGGQSVYICGACWSLVLRDSQTAHTGWHLELHNA